MTTKERVVQLAENSGMLKAAFLKKVGLRRGFLDTDKMGASVSDRQLALILAAFPNVSLEWLVTGEGAMYKPTVILPPDSISIDRYEAKVEECVRLRIELESKKSKRTVSAKEK